MKKSISKGKFIVLEGGEACGKSSQINALKKLYKHENFLFTREPGGTDLADQIREIIVKGATDKMLPETELALIYAARNEHLHKTILPALYQGINVISDRFNLSSYIYQGAARGIAPELIDNFNNIFLQNFKPDLTLLLDVNLEIAAKRIKIRNETDERFEKFGSKFHQKIRASFLEYAQKDPAIKIIDASLNLTKVHKLIKAEIEQLINV
ncbi:MAG: dTMP kinase [Rickettsiales bacterium]